MDKVGADFLYATNTLKERLGANAHPVQFPIGAEDEFEGIIDLLEMKAYYYLDEIGTMDEPKEIPAELQDKADELRASLIEAVADFDEDIMMQYLEGEEIATADLKKVIRKATLDVEFYPVFCGSAFKNRGVQLILDGVIDYLPAPTDIPPIQGIIPGTEEETERPADDNAPFSALAFKVMTDPFVGKLTFFRVYSGTLKAGSYVQNTAKE